MAICPKTIITQSIFPILAAVILCILVACGNGNGNKTVITVYAAASLTDAFGDIAREFESRNPSVEVKLNFAGSQRLRSQLELGAAADVSPRRMRRKWLWRKEGGLIAGSSRPFAGASLAVIASMDSEIYDASEIAEPGVKLVLAHESVPAGRYSRRLLARLSETDTGLGADFAERTLANVVSEETSVKFVEQKVVLGQADAGVVYQPGAMTAEATDAARKLPLPPEADIVWALFPIAVMRESGSPEWAEEFVEFVLSPHAQSTLAGYGFQAP